MLMNLAELAAYVRDVKPESDVHSNLPNHRSPLEKNLLQISSRSVPCCAPFRIANDSGRSTASSLSIRLLIEGVLEIERTRGTARDFGTPRPF